MTARAMSQESICSLVEDGTLQLETEAGRKPDYNGVVVTVDTLLVIDNMAMNLQLYSRRDGKLLSTSHKLESYPIDVCLISKTKVAVCMWECAISTLSFKPVDDVKLDKTLYVGKGFDACHSVAKWNSDKLVVSGWKKYPNMLMVRWGVVSITDGRVHSTHDICEGHNRSQLAIQDNTVYISCCTSDSTTNGVYAYDIFNPHTHKFLYQHQELKEPGWIMADKRKFVYVFDSNRIHQLTDNGQLVTIHTLSSCPYGIFYDDQHGVLYTTSYESNLISVYRMKYSHQRDTVISTEVLKMDTTSLQMYKEALNEGKEKVYNIKVMVVGQYGVGKTTLTQRLLGKNVNISERQSTEGIDVHVECSKVSLPAGEWTTQEKNAEQYSRLQRLVKFLNERAQKQELKSEQEGQGDLDGQVTSEENDNRHSQHDQIASAEPDSNRDVKSPTSQAVDSPIARVVPEANSEKEAKEKEKDTVMEILQLINENSGNLEKNTMEYAALALWDFAGQYVFYTTHQTFLTSRAIYLLVIDLSQQTTDLIKDDECFLDMEGIKLCKVHDLIEIWMNSIHSCTPSSQPGIPYVILVGTHVDKIPENCRQRVIDEYFIHICEILSNKPAASHLKYSIAIDNTQSDIRLEELKKIIFELAKQQPHWGEEKPARWLPLEQAIMTLKASGVKVAPLSLIEEINRSGSVRIENRDELDLFLRFQHEMGTILYFSIEGLSEKILLDPQWLIDAQKSLITAGTFINKNPAIVSKWCEFKRSGKLTHELIDAVWSKEKNPEFHDNKDHIILLMEKLNIIARPRTYDQEGNEIKVENYFLAPCMLRETAPEEVISPKPLPDMESSSVLCYVFVEKFLPSPIFHRLLAACVANWPVAKKNSENLIYCGCCVFHLDLHHRLTVFFRGHVIFVRVTRMGTTGKTPSSQLYTEVKGFITMTLSKIIGNLEQSLRFELHIQCPRSDGYSVNSLIPVSDLQGNVDVPCHSHTESHVIMSCDLLKFWFQEEKRDSVVLKDQTTPEECPISLHRRALPPGKKYHAFFSYSTSDIQWVKQTVERLEKDHGFFCREYDRDNTPGRPLLNFVDDGIKYAYKTVIVMSRAALLSSFVLLEIQMAINQGFNESRNCVVPVLLEDCEVPGYLRVLNYVDARDNQKRNIWWPKLLMELENKEVKGQTVIEGIGAGKESKVSKKGAVASMDRVPSTSIKKGNTGIQDQILPQAHDVRAKTESFQSKLYQFKGVPCSDPKLLYHILHQAASSSQSTLEENCLSVGLELHGETPADGNCFFEAVSSQLRRLNCVVQKSPQQLRQEVVAFMKTNRVLDASEGTIHLDSFVYESFDDYCMRMAKEGEWADHVVVVAMARMLRIDIMIVTSSPSSGPEDVIVWVVGQTAFQEDPILLGHVWESHYQSLQPIGDKTLDVMGRDERIEHITPERSTQMEQADVLTVVEGKRAGTKSKVSEKGNVTSIKILHSTSSKKDSSTSELKRRPQTPVAPTSVAQTTHLSNVQTSTPTASTRKVVPTAAPTTKESAIKTKPSKACYLL